MPDQPYAVGVGFLEALALFVEASERLDRYAAWARRETPFGFFARVLGRKPNAAETRFFIDFATVAVGSGGGPTKTVQGTPIAVSDARGAARLAAQSLGVRTRVVSVTVRPLPHRRLPGGLRRSSNVRLYRVVLDLLRANGIDKPGRNTIYVYVTRSAKLGVWRVAWLSQKP